MKRSMDVDCSFLTEAYTALRHEENDLRVVAGASVEPSQFCLLAILRNEMYFLPEFLAHYRSLGVERFVFLNDRSDDGSFEYLVQQPDAVVVQSARTYGDTFEIPPRLVDTIKNPRLLYLWRAMLHEMFASNQWAIQVDLDEFIRLPDGVIFQELLADLDNDGVRVVWGVMLDAYPEDIATLHEQEMASRLDTSGTWYFDGEKHLRLRQGRPPRTIHPGARARLYFDYDLDLRFPGRGFRKCSSTERWLRKCCRGIRPLRYNMLHKPTLLKWRDDCYFHSSHVTNLSASTHHLLPIQHFRFTGSLYRKIRTALQEGSYFLGSSDYQFLSELLKSMEARNGSFLYRKSRALDSFGDLADTGNAIGL